MITVLKYFHTELVAMMKIRKDANDQDAGHFHDFPHGHVAATYADLFDDDRAFVAGLSVDGASFGGNAEGEFWSWLMSIYNFPPDSHRYKNKYLSDVMISYGPNVPTNLESFALPIYERLAEAAKGI